MSKPLTDDGPMVQLTIGELKAIVTEAVNQALDARETKPEVLDLDGICKALRVSERTVLTFRKDGMPHWMLGDSPRFNLDEVQAWFRLQDTRAIAAVLAEVDPIPDGAWNDPDVAAAVTKRVKAVRLLAKPGQPIDLGRGMQIKFAPKKKVTPK